jgi:hypothetical protein
VQFQVFIFIKDPQAHQKPERGRGCGQAGVVQKNLTLFIIRSLSSADRHPAQQRHHRFPPGIVPGKLPTLPDLLQPGAHLHQFLSPSRFPFLLLPQLGYQLRRVGLDLLVSELEEEPIFPQPSAGGCHFIRKGATEPQFGQLRHGSGMVLRGQQFPKLFQINVGLQGFPPGGGFLQTFQQLLAD